MKPFYDELKETEHAIAPKLRLKVAVLQLPRTQENVRRKD